MLFSIVATFGPLQSPHSGQEYIGFVFEKIPSVAILEFVFG